MKTIDKKSWKRVIYPLLFIILSAIIIFNLVRISNTSANKVVVYRTGPGWGYRILQGDKVTIDQSFIPLLAGRTPFPSRYSAKQTGKLVLDRLEKGIVPVITFEDLEELGLVK